MIKTKESETTTYTWTTQSGATVTATCELILSETQFADGQNIETATCKQRFSIAVEGKGTVGLFISRKPQEMGGIMYPATCGKLVISQENLDAIDAMVEIIELHPAWVAKIASEKAAAIVSDEYADHSAMMTKATAE